MNYKEAVEWLNSFQNQGIKLGLDRIRFICEKLGNPQFNYKVVHIGGTNGKGTVCRIISSILEKGGYKVGLYLSPHLQRFTERMQINSVEISNNDVVSLIERIRPIVEELKKNSELPTYFEIVTAMSFLYFDDKEVEFAVVEVGLGGRFDATNIVKPEISIITNVSMEHENYLGNDISSIAYEKAGIIKSTAPVISAAREKPLNVIKKVAAEKKSELIIVDNDCWERISKIKYLQKFKIKTSMNEFEIKTRLLGYSQGQNIAIALYVIEYLQMKGVFLSEDAIFEGVEIVVNPGRLEIISEHPIILLDGAHNPDAMNFLSDFLTNDLVFDKLILIIGILKDKNIDGILKKIIPLADVIIVTSPKNIRACDPLIIENRIKELFDRECIVKNDISKGISYAKSIVSDNDLICITGSLFTIGEARDYFGF